MPSAPPRPKQPQRKGGFGVGKAGGVCTVGGLVAYNFSPEVRETVDPAFASFGEAFEDMNDATQEVLESVADMFCAKKEGPWLLDLATMKYPENIPTLVLDLDRVLLKLEHSSSKGWHVVKRPYADQFIKELSMYYEIVIFSDEVFPIALDIATKWNLPVTGVLHRDFCRKKRAHYIKDLSQLGRNLERVLFIDHDPAAFQLQPENGIQIREFEGDHSDAELVDLLEFLKAAASTPTDIRTFLAKFGGGDMDVGRRYLVHKQDQDAKVESRRSLGKAFAAKQGFPQAPTKNSFGGMGSGRRM